MKKQSNYYDMIHRCGVIWDIGALLVLLCVPAAFCLYLDVGPNLKALGSAMLKLIPLYWPVALIEIFTYVPMLGAGATYLSFVTGNIPNLKLPCGLNAMESAGVRPNSDEGEVISTIAVGVSSTTTTVIIAVGVIAFSPVLPLITADGSIFKPAFEQVLPALFGALGASYFVKHWRLAFAPHHHRRRRACIRTHPARRHSHVRHDSRFRPRRGHNLSQGFCSDAQKEGKNNPH